MHLNTFSLEGVRRFNRNFKGIHCTKKKVKKPCIRRFISFFRSSIKYNAQSKEIMGIQIIQPTRCKSFTSLLLDVNVWLNMFWASPRPSSGAYNCTRSLWFYRWREVAGAFLVVVCQTTTNKASTAYATHGNSSTIAADSNNDVTNTKCCRYSCLRS